jgi:Domain of Unknown Function (DUF1206)
MHGSMGAGGNRDQAASTRGTKRLSGTRPTSLVRAGVGHGTEQNDNGFQLVAGVASGVAYAVLCITAMKILTRASSSGGSNSPKQTIGGVPDWPGATVIIGVLGAILIGVALFRGVQGLSKKFLDDSNTREISREVKRAFTTIGVFGHLARMVVFVLIRCGPLTAAIDESPHTAIGLDGALNKLSHNSYMDRSCWASSPPG